ncbi:unnamed protein product [Macrosiphum euphorbiae]|uniref:Activating transcription factor 7-interacting protein Fn3 domain-containing protein n=1 Tax=Macrosiphum euphorbiae TaxID=13131 RepID=A0AAV0WJT0_9HEMI|nr:unnamed protein product [Macrosiphum euphorbiae]
MNNHKSGRDKNKKEVPQIGLEIDDSVVKCSLSTFNNILERECINFMLKWPEKEDIIVLNNLVNHPDWKSKYKKLETQARMFDSIGNVLKKDLKINKFAQPVRCLSGSVIQHVIVTMAKKGKKTRDTASYALKGSKKKCQVFTLSDSDDDVIITDTSNIKSIQTKNVNIIDLIDLDNDTENLEVNYKPAPKSKTNCQSNSEDDPVIITDTSKIKPIPTKNNNIIDLIDLDNDTENLEVKYKLAPKSNINCKSNSEDDLVIKTDTSKIKPIPTKNDNIIDLDNDTENLEVKFKAASKSKTNDNKVLPIKTEAGNTLSNREFLSTNIQKRKPGPKSKTMFVSDMVPFNAENEETPAKKMRLNECEVIKKKELNTINFSNFNSMKKLEDAENLKSSILKYPPPYPLIPPHNSQPSWKDVPPRPNLSIMVSENKVTLIWDLIRSWQTAKIKMYELFVCQESDAPPHISMWKKKGNIEADKLPMACELEVSELGHIYYFALRAVDVHDRCSPCDVKKTKI